MCITETESGFMNTLLRYLTCLVIAALTAMCSPQGKTHVDENAVPPCNEENKHNEHLGLTEFKYSYDDGFSPKSLNDSATSIVRKLMPYFDWFKPDGSMMAFVDFPAESDIYIQLSIQYNYYGIIRFVPNKITRSDMQAEYSWFIPSKGIEIGFTTTSWPEKLTYSDLGFFKSNIDPTFYKDEYNAIKNTPFYKGEKVLMSATIKDSKVISIEGICEYYKE